MGVNWPKLCLVVIGDKLQILVCKPKARFISAKVAENNACGGFDFKQF